MHFSVSNRRAFSSKPSTSHFIWISIDDHSLWLDAPDGFVVLKGCSHCKIPENEKCFSLCLYTSINLYSYIIIFIVNIFQNIEPFASLKKCWLGMVSLCINLRSKGLDSRTSRKYVSEYIIGPTYLELHKTFRITLIDYLSLPISPRTSRICAPDLLLF